MNARGFGLEKRAVQGTSNHVLFMHLHLRRQYFPTTYVAHIHFAAAKVISKSWA